MLVDPGGGTASFVGISDAVTGITAAAKSGFTISESGGQPLLNAIQDLQDEIENALNQSARLGLQPALGTTPAATVYKPFLATVASDPTQGAIPVLVKLLADLNDAHAAIQKSMANYKGTDAAAASSVKTMMT
jgi:hypothetical protein